MARAIGAKSFDDVFEDYVLERTLERAIQIVSEAAKALPADLTARYNVIPWHAVIAIGNQLRHEYYRIKQAEVWEIATAFSSVADRGGRDAGRSRVSLTSSFRLAAPPRTISLIAWWRECHRDRARQGSNQRSWRRSAEVGLARL
ncbi:DUF86 domain-containing protein [Beijerinckia sp. L45]|uniref:HepT-like ribonuclease domain-containing protein n=1 Tax=Beijerinckia sp. L45 TaxID=1641855 RepID=UPI00131D1869|nr:HepT-like ribonuclease domain-containing protein [Beijerinckia sp. L45]